MDAGTNNKLKKRYKVKSYPGKKVDDIEAYFRLIEEIYNIDIPVINRTSTEKESKNEV